MRFLQDTDYGTLIREEIRRLLDGRLPDGTGTPGKLLTAEDMAIQQITNWLNGRYDCSAIFSAPSTPDDLRDKFMVMITIDLALYHLYSQTGNKDIPAHRSQRYEDALDWLKKAGRGEIGAALPTYPQEQNQGDIRIFSRPPECHRW